MKSPVEKNKQYVVKIIDQGYEGEGIAKIENFTIFVPSALLGETVQIQIVKVLSSHAFGKIVKIQEASSYRCEADCATYKRCGGCNLRHMQYAETLKLKEYTVRNLVQKTLQTSITIKPVIGMSYPYYYRNKAQFPLGRDKEGKPIMGVYANRTHDIIQIQECKIQDPKAEEIAKAIYQYIVENKLSIYDEKTASGLFRHIMIRIGKKTNQIMCVFVVNKETIPQEEKMVQTLITNYPEITTIVKNINPQNTNVILGKENRCLYGKGYIEDYLDKYIFKISPLSFYQVNPVQTEELYKTAIEKAQLQPQDIVLDLYCGIGTIGIFAAEKVKQVYGIEIVKEAIEDAKENARRNNISNITFFAGDVEEILDSMLQEEGITPTVAIVDPPRKGLDKHTISILQQKMPRKIVYISCNPATLVRDLKELEEQYSVQEIQPVDMFPFTSHVEVCALLEIKNYQ